MSVGYNYLTETQKRQFARNLVQRRAGYEQFQKTNIINDSKKILVVGDRPGPGAKDFSSDHHNTPFYAKTYCSGWMNALLVEAEVPEEPLLWINSASYEGEPTKTAFFKTRSFETIIALGNNASAWLSKAGMFHEIFSHPQYHKRFKNGEQYALIPRLQELTKYTLKGELRTCYNTTLAGENNELQ